MRGFLEREGFDSGKRDTLSQGLQLVEATNQNYRENNVLSVNDTGILRKKNYHFSNNLRISQPYKCYENEIYRIDMTILPNENFIVLRHICVASAGGTIGKHLYENTLFHLAFHSFLTAGAVMPGSCPNIYRLCGYSARKQLQFLLVFLNKSITRK